MKNVQLSNQVELSNTQQKCLENAAKKEEVQRTFQNKILEIEASFEREFGIKEHKVSIIEYVRFVLIRCNPIQKRNYQRKMNYERTIATFA